MHGEDPNMPRTCPRACPAPASHFPPSFPLQTFPFSAFLYFSSLSTVLLTQHPPSTHHSNAFSLQLLPLIRLRHQTLHKTTATRICRGQDPNAPHPPHTSDFLCVFLHFSSLSTLLLAQHPPSSPNMPRTCRRAAHFRPAFPLQTFPFSAFLHFSSLSTLLLTQHPPSTHHSNASSQLQLLPLIRLRHQTLHKTTAARISQGEDPSMPRTAPFLSKPSLSLRFPTLLLTFYSPTHTAPTFNPPFQCV